MKFNIKNKNTVILWITALIIFGMLLFTIVRLNKVQSELNNTKEELSKQNTLILNEIDDQKSLLRPAVDTNNKRLVVPEVNISLPYNDVTKTFQYTYAEGEYGYLRITSTLISDRNPERQIGCTELAIISFDNGEPFNPWTEVGGSTRLADGRTLYIISPISFENSEGSTLSCESEVWTKITPRQVAEELRNAESL